MEFLHRIRECGCCLLTFLDRTPAFELNGVWLGEVRRTKRHSDIY